jgi:hypothetical protein
MSPSSLSALMAFYRPDASMDQRLTALVRRLAGERGEPLVSGLSITWLRYPESLLAQDPQGLAGNAWRAVAGVASASPARGACWQGLRLGDPGDLVQLVYLMASERWLQRGLLEDEPELRRAQQAMIRGGSHEATSYVVDRLSGTTSGPALSAFAQEAWTNQRQLVNRWLTSLGWAELEGCQAVQKTWQDGPYGRERQFLGTDLENANRFSSDGLARLFEGVLAGTVISPPACQRMCNLLAVPEPVDMANADVPAGLVSLLPPAASGFRRFWGRGGRGPRSHQVLLYGEGEGQDPALLVVLAEPGKDGGRDGVVAEIVAELLGAEVAAG